MLWRARRCSCAACCGLQQMHRQRLEQRTVPPIGPSHTDNVSHRRHLHSKQHMRRRRNKLAPRALAACAASPAHAVHVEPDARIRWHAGGGSRVHGMRRGGVQRYVRRGECRERGEKRTHGARHTVGIVQTHTQRTLRRRRRHARDAPGHAARDAIRRAAPAERPGEGPALGLPLHQLGHGIVGDLIAAQCLDNQKHGRALAEHRCVPAVGQHPTYATVPRVAWLSRRSCSAQPTSPPGVYISCAVPALQRRATCFPAAEARRSSGDA